MKPGKNNKAKNEFQSVESNEGQFLSQELAETRKKQKKLNRRIGKI